MKSFYIILVFILTNIGSSLAQENWIDKLEKFKGKDDTIGQLKGSRYLVIGEGVVAFKNGTQQNGNVEFEIAVKPYEMNNFMFTPEGQMKANSINESEVEYFSVNGHTFYPVKLKLDETAIGNTRIFAEMLHNSSEDPFKMYLLRMVAPTLSQGKTDKDFVLSRSFYVMLPEFKVGHDLEDLNFMPFAKKMSNYLKDCPEIADKIKNKEEGYKYNMFSGAANYAVFYRIMDEYNACKSSK